MFGRKKVHFFPQQSPYNVYGDNASSYYPNNHNVRQQPIPQLNGNQQWSGYQNVNPYQMPSMNQSNNYLGYMNGMPNSLQPFSGNYPSYPSFMGNFNGFQGEGNVESFSQNANKKKSNTQTIYQNPLQQIEESYSGPSNNPAFLGNNIPYMNPYPKQSAFPRPPSGMQSILNSFKTQDGNLDFNKMVDTAGQMMNAFTQVSSMVKGIGGIFKV
ncbi:YppG family protein [Bacillus sp. 31A1R]|uniref:YppG family protein n=1 Tax=Robertmurraya mangrovi TaxID=3098077 RepID=A0ABU5J1J4_9BACI|nr:YppG family protein [Bacillus sp. 31A1R]MDZ5473215.1 YppG family protein [Bacillus sp. 31A1R]